MTLFYAVGFVELSALTPCMFGRLSFAVFLLALLAPTMQWKRWMLWSVIVVQIVNYAIVVSMRYRHCCFERQNADLTGRPFKSTPSAAPSHRHCGTLWLENKRPANLQPSRAISATSKVH